jgi:hypothetical protein
MPVGRTDTHDEANSHFFAFLRKRLKTHVPSNMKSEFQGAKNACVKCLHSGETTAFQSCCSLILLNFNLQA